MAKQVNFFDGAQSSTTPTIGDVSATSLVQYANDAAFEAANTGSPIEGNIYANTTSNVIRYYNGTVWTSILDADSTATLTNKTIDATAATGTNTVTMDAVDTTYDPAASGLVTTNVQAAINELDADIDGNETAIGTNSQDIDDLEALSGNFGSTVWPPFTGTTIPDSSTTKLALQSLETAVETKLGSSEKGAANGIAELDGTGKVPAAQLPSFVDDVEEYANLAAFPVTGETGKIYVALDTNKTYRWTGSVYIEVSASDVTSVNSQTGAVVLNTNDINDITITSATARDQIRRNAGNTAWENYDPESEVNDTATGANATLNAVTTSIVRMTNASLLSVDGIPAGSAGQKMVLVNATTVPTIINNETGATAANRITTGTGGPLDLDIDASIILSYDSTDSRWRIVGGSGAGGGGVLGVITGNNSLADSTSGDWAAYADAAATTPADGTGGSPSVTLTRTTSASEILNGKGSFKITKDAVNRQGEGVSLLVDVPKYLRGQNAIVRFSYSATANYDPGDEGNPIADPADISVFLYDITNTNLITPTTPGVFGSEFYESPVVISSTTEQVRVILHIATDSALAYDFVFDNVELTIGAVTVSPVTPKTLYVKDIQSSGTHAGTFTSGAWQTRTLNTTEGDTSFVTLGSNQMTLTAGTYQVEAVAGAHDVDNHKIKLRNITDSTDDIIGASSYCNSTSGETQTTSIISGVITIASSKTFEIQHRCATTKTTTGLGVASGFGVSEVYTQVKIVKVL